MNHNEELIEALYQAIEKADIEAIRSIYATDVRYSDPIFGELRGERAVAMWEMLLSSGGALKVTYSDIVADERTGSGRWLADYTFNGRPVLNQITSRFVFADGRIAEQHDQFSVRGWAAHAIGAAGRIAGGTPPMKAMMHRASTRMLDKHQSKKASG